MTGSLARGRGEDYVFVARRNLRLARTGEGCECDEVFLSVAQELTPRAAQAWVVGIDPISPQCADCPRRRRISTDRSGADAGSAVGDHPRGRSILTLSFRFRVAPPQKSTPHWVQHRAAILLLHRQGGQEHTIPTWSPRTSTGVPRPSLR